MGCVFCKIVNGDIPSFKVYEDEYTVVFMDIANDVDGHMLAIPKKHVKCILDCDTETLSVYESDFFHITKLSSQNLLGNAAD